jgi:hypothetical protein
VIGDGGEIFDPIGDVELGDGGWSGHAMTSERKV